LSLSGWDKAILESLAQTYRTQGKVPARQAFSKLALANGWHGTPMWLDGRAFFNERREFYRKAYMASLVAEYGKKP
jgi:hypothetical protein